MRSATASAFWKSRRRHFGAHASLDDIAAQAGVGPGTLYRHFPTRDALIEAVYRTEVEKPAAAEHTFTAAVPPLALRAWMLRGVDRSLNLAAGTFIQFRGPAHE